MLAKTICQGEHGKARHWRRSSKTTEKINACSGKSTATCGNTPSWDVYQHWSTYSVGDMRVHDDALYECHDPQWAQSYAPSSPYGYLAWTHVTDC